MSQLKYLIKVVWEKGYRIIGGKCYTPKGKILKGTIKKHPIPYRQFSIKLKIGEIEGIKGARSIMYHGLLAYQLYGDEYFKKGIVARHLNGNSLDNSDDNIILGTQKDNKLDIPKEKRIDAYRKGMKTREDILMIKAGIMNDVNNGLGAKQIYKKYGVCINTVYKIIRSIR